MPSSSQTGNRSVVEVPFIADKAIDASLAIHNLLQKGLLRNYNVIVPLMLVCGQQYAVHSTFEVKVPSDLKGKKMRAAGQLQHYMAQSFGAAPIGMPVTKIAESMSRGVKQTTTNEWNAMRTFKIEEVARYHCMFPMDTQTFLLAMNKDSFDKLPLKKATNIYTGIIFPWAGSRYKCRWANCQASLRLAHCIYPDIVISNKFWLTIYKYRSFH